MKRREFNKNLAAVTAVSLSPFSLVRIARAATTSGATPVFSYPNGFAQAGSDIAIGAASVNGSAIQLPANQGHLSAYAWYTAQQPATAFTTQFTFQPTGLGSSVAQSGITFCIQNTTAATGGYHGLNLVGDANMCGYGGGILQPNFYGSVAIKFDAGNESMGQGYPARGLPSSTGLYFNGGPKVKDGNSLGLVPFNDLNPYGVNLYTGNVFQVTIVYDGTLLTMVILDTKTNAQARYAWPLNLANTTGSAQNWVGITAGTAAIGHFNLLSWSYWSGYNTRLATPSFSPSPAQYAGTQTVAISYPPGSTCYYTTNGLLPTSSSTQYTGPITVSSNTVIQAVAIQSGYTDSLVGTAPYQINTSNVINFPNGFSAGNLVNSGFAYLSGSAMRLTDTTPGTSGSAWFPIPVNISTFSTTFTLNWGSSGQGMCFVIQNNPLPYTSGESTSTLGWSGGPTVVGVSSGGFGYGGMNAYSGTAGESYGLLNSIAILFNQYGGSGDPSNSVGLYTNGATPYGVGAQTATGFAFVGSFNVTLTYDGTNLSLSMQSTSGGRIFTHSWPVNIPSTVGASTAYVGFTGGTGGAASIQAVQSWTFTASQASQAQSPSVPAAPTNLHVT